MTAKRNRRLWLILVRSEVLKLIRRGEAVRKELVHFTGADPAKIHDKPRKARTA